MIIRFSRTHSALSKLIRLSTWSKFSHVDILIEPDVYLGALPGEGVVFHNEKPRDFQFCEIAVPESAIAFAQSQVGKPYDYTGILGFGLHRNWQDDRKWFCSELIAAACLHGGVRLFHEEFHNLIYFLKHVL